jgi:hypothetical protein
MPRRLISTTAVAMALLLLVASCSSSKTKTATSSTTTPPPGQVTTTTVPEAQGVLFSATDGNIDAYLTLPPYTRQRVVATGTGPAGTTPHGQICFTPDGSRRFVIAETRTPPGAAATAGWGLYQLTGDDIGTFRVRRVAGWDSPGAPSTDAPTTYGCAFLPDGRLFTTDIGNQRSGPSTGRLVEWFPPFDTATPGQCVLATDLATPLGLAADPAGALYLASARAPTAGIWRYRGTFPADPAACVTATPEPPDQTTTTIPQGPAAPPGTVPAGSPSVTVKLLIAGGASGLNAPTAVAVAPSGQAIVVSSAPDGLIVAFDLEGIDPTPLLTPVEPRSPATRSPFGLTIAPDGSVLYADTGLVATTAGVIAPGDSSGSLDSIATTGNRAQPPLTVDNGLDAPDGVGLYLPLSASGGAASKA